MVAWSRPASSRRWRILGLNVNGLSIHAKRKALFSRLSEMGQDIVILQETHCDGDDTAEAWVRAGAGAGRPWGGKAFWSHGRRASRGVAVLFKAGFPGTDFNVEFTDASSAPDRRGRVLRIGWRDSQTNEHWSVIAAYAPNSDVDQQVFFAQDGPLAQALRSGPTGATVVLAGDFNCVLDADDSSAPTAAAQAATPGANALRELLAQSQLGDAWQHYRARHQADDSQYTYWSTSGGTARRLDRAYVSSSLLSRSQLLACRHMPLGDMPGDHAPVELHLAVEGLPSTAPPRWRLPLDLLVDAGFTADIRADLACASVRQGRNWETMAGSSTMQVWLKLKQRVRTISRIHTQRRKQAMQAQRAAVVAGVNAATVMFDTAVSGTPQPANGSPAPPSATEAARHLRVQASQLRAFDLARAGRDAAKADAVWHHYGEKPTFWFHRLGEQHAQTAPMTRVKDPTTGQPIVATSRAEAQRGAEVVADFFDGDQTNGLFAPAATDARAQGEMLNHIDKKLSAEDAASCEGPTPDGSLTADELKRALKTMQRGKSPGMDGIPYEFYLTFWNDLSTLLTAAVNEEFLSSATTPKYDWRFTLGIISLLFKGTAQKPLPEDQVASYRPITLLNCDYKLVAKAMALRMAAALDTVIDDTQTAFVPGRWIGDNVLCHMGIIDMLCPDTDHPAASAPSPGQPDHSHATTSIGTPPATAPSPVAGPAGSVTGNRGQVAQSSSACILFLDFEKAYDRVVREWIFACFEKLGFGPFAMRWLRLLLEGTQAVVSFGGCFSRMFAVRSGAAQGSPLSPLLYVTAAQPLAAALRRLQRDGIIDSVHLPAGVTAPASHQHADDTSIHTATVEGAKKALDLAVQPFCQASGSKLSISKSEGLTLGSHPPLEGDDPVTGVKFIGPTGAIKHLGVLLTKGGRAAPAKALWQQRIKSVAAQVSHWRTVDLTLLGRVYVARQVMANSITYHAQFVEPPKPQLQALQRLIDGFVLGQPVNPDTDDRPLRGRPSAATYSLPLQEGGLAAADVELQATAMRAKVAARLVHPQRRPWKVLARAEFERALPGIGVAVMLTTIAPTSRAARNLSPRLSSYWSALRRTHPHRLVPPEDMLAQQVGREPLPGNRRVAPPQGPRAALTWEAARAQWGTAWRLGDLNFVGAGTSPPADVPPSWASKLALPPPRTAWAVCSDGCWVRYSKRGQERLFLVATDGRLLDPPSGARPAQHSSSWQDCCIVTSPTVKGRPPGAAEPLPPVRPWDPEPSRSSQDSEGEHPPPKDLYLVGPWTAVSVDPMLWGHTEVPLTYFCVKDATLRMKRLRAMREMKDRYSPCEAVAPQLWGPGAADHPADDAVQAVASRQAQVYAEKLQSRSSIFMHVSDDQFLAMYRQPWMEASPSRPSPTERARQRREHAARPAQPAQPDDRDDNADALKKWAEGRPAWRKAWLDTQRKRKPRSHRVFEWQLLHNALPLGGAKAAFVPSGATNVADVVCCSNPACRPVPPQGSPHTLGWPPETLIHALIQCPAVRPALQWLANLWIRIDGGSAPPLLPSVWLQGSTEAWSPHRRTNTDLWHALRISLLASAWSLRMRRVTMGEPFGPSQVVDACVADVRRLVLADWQVASGRCTNMAGTHSSWFPGREPELDVVQFETRWCGGGVIAHVTHGAGGQSPSMEFRLEEVASGGRGG